MGCNCKKNVNKKYVDQDELGQTLIEEASMLAKTGNFFMKIFFGLLIAVILLGAILPAFVYIIIRVCLGKELKINLRIPERFKPK